MKNLAYTLLAMTVIFGMSVNSYAQIPEEIPRLKEIKASKLTEKIVPQKHKSGLWGYADSEGKFVVRPVFNAAYEYEGNVARINWNMKCMEPEWLPQAAVRHRCFLLHMKLQKTILTCGRMKLSHV